MIEQREESIELETQLHFKGRGIILNTENTILEMWNCGVDIHLGSDLFLLHALKESCINQLFC